MVDNPANIFLIMDVLLTVLLFFHAYLAIRYCVSNIYPAKEMDLLTKYKHLLLVVVIPFVGYYLVAKKESKLIK